MPDLETWLTFPSAATGSGSKRSSPSELPEAGGLALLVGDARSFTMTDQRTACQCTHASLGRGVEKCTYTTIRRPHIYGLIKAGIYSHWSISARFPRDRNPGLRQGLLHVVKDCLDMLAAQEASEGELMRVLGCGGG